MGRTQNSTPAVFTPVRVEGSDLDHLSHFLYLYNRDTRPWSACLKHWWKDKWGVGCDVKCFPSVPGVMQAGFQGDTWYQHQFQHRIDRNLPWLWEVHPNSQYRGGQSCLWCFLLVGLCFLG